MTDEQNSSIFETTRVIRFFLTVLALVQIKQETTQGVLKKRVLVIGTYLALQAVRFIWPILASSTKYRSASVIWPKCCWRNSSLEETSLTLPRMSSICWDKIEVKFLWREHNLPRNFSVKSPFLLTTTNRRYLIGFSKILRMTTVCWNQEVRRNSMPLHWWSNAKKLRILFQI